MVLGAVGARVSAESWRSPDQVRGRSPNNEASISSKSFCQRTRSVEESRHDFRRLGPCVGLAARLLELESAFARTPLGRLGISYQIVPQYVIRESPFMVGEPWEEPSGIVPYYTLPLGVGLYLDSLLGGGVNGQPLPMGVTAVVDPLGTVVNVTG